MAIAYTEHAKQRKRMKDRNITKAEVEETLDQPYFTHAWTDS